MSERQLVNNLRAHGFELARQRKHRVYKNSAGSTFVIPSTPSDRRWSAKALADLARLCGPAETDSRPLRARRQHGKLERIIEAPSVEPLERQPQAAEMPAPALSRADQQRLKRWEKHESQRGAKPERRLAKLRDLAYRAHRDLAYRAIQCGGDRGLLIVSLTTETYYRVRQLGFHDVALSVADVALNDYMGASTTHVAVAIYVRVGSRFLDILEGVLREGPNWTEDGAMVDVWADLLHPGDFTELNGQQMYLGSDRVDPSRFRLELKIPDGQTVELTLFEALLSYGEGVAPVIFVNGEYLMHGKEMLKAHAEGAKFKVNVFRLEGRDAKEIARAFNAQDCDWPKMLEAGRRIFMERSKPAVGYIAWLKYEIAKRLEETNGASQTSRA